MGIEQLSNVLPSGPLNPVLATRMGLNELGEVIHPVVQKPISVVVPMQFAIKFCLLVEPQPGIIEDASCWQRFQLWWCRNNNHLKQSQLQMYKELVNPIENPLARLWIIYQCKIKIQREFKVQLKINNRGILIKYNENIDKVVEYINRKVAAVDFRIIDSQEQIELIKNQGATVECLQLRNILDVGERCQAQELVLNIYGEYLLVFKKKYQHIVDSILGNLLSELLKIEEKEIITLLGFKVWLTCQDKYGCSLKMQTSGLCVVEGPRESFEKCIELVNHTLKCQTWRIVLSNKETPYKQHIARKIISHLKTYRNTFWLDQQKFKQRIKMWNIDKGQEILNSIIKNHGKFLMVFYSVKNEQIVGEIKSIIDLQVKRHQIESSSQESKKTDEYKYFSGTVQQAKQRNKYSCQIHYQNLFRSKMTKDSKISMPTYEVPKHQKYLQFDQPQKRIPIHPLVLQAIAKFDNFKNKLNDLQKNYNVRFRTQILNGQCFLLFTTNDRFKNVYYDLQFFFQELPINCFSILSKGKLLLDQSVSNKLIQVVKNDIKLKEVVVGPIQRRKNDLTLQIFNARHVNMADPNKDEVQRVLRNISGDRSISLARIHSETHYVEIRKHMPQF